MRPICSSDVSMKRVSSRRRLDGGMGIESLDHLGGVERAAVMDGLASRSPAHKQGRESELRFREGHRRRLNLEPSVPAHGRWFELLRLHLGEQLEGRGVRLDRAGEASVCAPGGRVPGGRRCDATRARFTCGLRCGYVALTEVGYKPGG